MRNMVESQEGTNDDEEDDEDGEDFRNGENYIGHILLCRIFCIYKLNLRKNECIMYLLPDPTLMDVLSFKVHIRCDYFHCCRRVTR